MFLWWFLADKRTQSRLGVDITRPGREFDGHRANRKHLANGKIRFFEMISYSYQDVVDSYHRLTSGGSAAADRSGRVRTPLTTHAFHARAP